MAYQGPGSYPRRQNYRGQNHRGNMPPHPAHLLQEIDRLQNLLTTERSRFMQENARAAHLHVELQQTRETLEYQKKLKERFINEAKEIKRELERFQRYAEPETLDKAKIASMMQSTLKQKKKKDLHRDYEELKVAFAVSEERLSKELQAEREKSHLLAEELDVLRLQMITLQQSSNNEALLKKELEDLKVSYEKLSCKYEADISAAREEAESLKASVQHLTENETLLQRELEDLKVSYEELSCKYEEDISAARKEETPRKELDQETKVPSDEDLKTVELATSLKVEQDVLFQTSGREMDSMTTATSQKDLDLQMESIETQLQENISVDDVVLEDDPNQQQMLVPVISVNPALMETQASETITETRDPCEPEEALQEIEEAPEKLSETPRRNPSFWKRLRHFLGLRKSSKKTKKGNQMKELESPRDISPRFP